MCMHCVLCRRPLSGLRPFHNEALGSTGPTDQSAAKGEYKRHCRRSERLRKSVELWAPLRSVHECRLVDPSTASCEPTAALLFSARRSLREYVSLRQSLRASSARIAPMSSLRSPSCGQVQFRHLHWDSPPPQTAMTAPCSVSPSQSAKYTGKAARPRRWTYLVFSAVSSLQPPCSPSSRRSLTKLPHPHPLPPPLRQSSRQCSRCHTAPMHCSIRQ